MNDQAPDAAMDFALRGIVFPAQPLIIRDIQREQSKPNADLRAIARLIAGDITLASSLLKMVNSPFYGLRRKIASVEEAVRLTGMSRVLHLARGLSLRAAMPPQPGLEHFWDESAQVAAIAVILARELKIDADLAYLMGLFHDSGIPLMAQKHPHYLSAHACARADAAIDWVKAENRLYDTDHARVGAVFAHYWYLPEALAKAIALHHDAEAFGRGQDNEVANLVAVNLMAEAVRDSFLGVQNVNWMRLGSAALDFLIFDESDWEALGETATAQWLACNGHEN
jgi:putative nucleotidyltransferase with HDIG domain